MTYENRKKILIKWKMLIHRLINTAYFCGDSRNSLLEDSTDLFSNFKILFKVILCLYSTDYEVIICTLHIWNAF